MHALELWVPICFGPVCDYKHDFKLLFLSTLSRTLGINDQGGLT